MLDYIVMQMRKTNCEKGYWHEPLRMFILHDIHVACMLLMNLFAVVVKTLCLVPRWAKEAPVFDGTWQQSF